MKRFHLLLCCIGMIFERVCGDPRFLPPSHLSRQYPNRSHADCWGYEPLCPKDYHHVECEEELDPFTGENSRKVFFDQADFGYVKGIVDGMANLCEPRTQFDSSLSCSDNLQFCTARNVFIDFAHVVDKGAKRSLRYSMEVLDEGKIGGKCFLRKAKLNENLEFMAPLQSWAPELRYFRSSDAPVDGIDSPVCDRFVRRPTIVMKIDASVSMYHHFCDFFNLYASLFINSTFYPDSFDRDVNILVWENTPYRSAFGDVFGAFTKHEILHLDSFGRKNICFKNLLMPLLPRMPFGLFYNTPVIGGCRNSALFKSFSEFLTFRLGIRRTESASNPTDHLMRVTFLSRRTKYRRVLNENSLISSLESTGRYRVKVAHFTHAQPTFLEQMQIVHDTDILIGMHGSGLTHLLFLPDWGCLFELYDCEDPGCYTDLARMRGVGRVSWTNSSLIFPEDDGDEDNEHRGHAKFRNYAFDEVEFVRKVDEAAALVRKRHPAFADEKDNAVEEDQDEEDTAEDEEDHSEWGGQCEWKDKTVERADGRDILFEEDLKIRDEL
jgi:protein O-GlcNAc transferase